MPRNRNERQDRWIVDGSIDARIHAPERHLAMHPRPCVGPDLQADTKPASPRHEAQSDLLPGLNGFIEC